MLLTRGIRMQLLFCFLLQLVAVSQYTEKMLSMSCPDLIHAIIPLPSANFCVRNHSLNRVLACWYIVRQLSLVTHRPAF